MAFCKNHDHLYFDSLRRTEKAEAVLCLIHATYQSKINNGSKEDIARLLKSAYELFRFTPGTYTGENLNQFESQYTIGHELGIWLNANLDLCSLALKVAKNEITIREYFDIFFLNYIQPIDNKIIHPLYMTLEYAKEKNLNTINKDDLTNIFSFASNSEKNNINGMFNMFIGSSYFSKLNDKVMKICYPVEDILECCNIVYINSDVRTLTDYFSDLNIYISYLTEDHRSMKLIQDKFIKSSIYQSGNLGEIGYNKIYYGIPGCGKSYKIKKDLEAKNVPQENIFRTTFYLDYSNSDFVGQILPKVEGDNVKYEHNPGPFTKALTRAFNTNDMVYLIIEEINRGNAAAIFGDLFQLLDRKKEDDSYGLSGESEYPITNEFIESYLKKNVDGGYDKEVIYIPNNLTILATMNTSDQNVFPLDTAFKRRWDMERVEGDIDACEFKDYYIPYTEITWQNFQEEVNKKISECSLNGLITEDKQLGPWFASKDMFVKEENQGDKKRLKKFVYNIMDYIYNDVCKFEKEGWFTGEVSFAEICRSILKYPDDQNIDKDLCLAFLKKYTDNKESNDDQS